MFHGSRQVMTSLKGPSPEHGDTSPDLDVLTGPPAEHAVASEVARSVPELPPAHVPDELPESIPTPIDEIATAATTPPEELPIEVGEPSPAADVPDEVAPPAEQAVTAPSKPMDGAPDPDLPVEPAAARAEMEIPDEIVEPLAIAEEIAAEAAQPESAADEDPPGLDVAEPPPTAPISVPAEAVEPEVVATDFDIVEPTAEPIPLSVAEAAPVPAPELPPNPPELPTPPPLAPIVAPAIASAITAPDVTTLEPPTQPAPAPPSPPPIALPAAEQIRASWRLWLRRAIIALIGLAVGYAVLILVLIVVYRSVDPPRSTVMLGLNLTGQSVDYEPVPITAISSNLQRAVVTSEDARFCRHRGVDWGALAEAMQDSRGGSTITMQTAKNLFLWPSRSYIRKAIEIPVALTIDFAWPKRRILEVYLNIAEWGPGVFGAEAAAQYHFGKPASRLTAHEATLLAAALPNPIAREAGDPGRVTALLASRLRARMANSDAYVTCLGLRPMPRAEPEPKQRPATATKPAQKPSPWQTKTEPAKPPTPFNPWQN
jgi:monofunctional glycosyltransferase